MKQITPKMDNKKLKRTDTMSISSLISNKYDKPQNQSSDSLAKALSSTEYRKMFDFFLAEIPDLALKVVGIDPIKSFKDIDEQLKSRKKGDCKLSLKKIYGGMNAK